MTLPVLPDPGITALIRIARAIEALAYQTETATLMHYQSMPYRGAQMRPVAARLNLPDPLDTQQESM